MHPETTADLEILLRLYGWQKGERLEQYLRSGNNADDAVVFHHGDFNASVICLHPLIDRNQETYAGWGFYDEGVLDRWGFDESDLRAFLAKILGERREFKC